MTLPPSTPGTLGSEPYSRSQVTGSHDTWGYQTGTAEGAKPCRGGCLGKGIRSGRESDFRSLASYIKKQKRISTSQLAAVAKHQRLSSLNNGHLCLTVLEMGSPKSRCRLIQFLVRALFLACRPPSCCAFTWQNERAQEQAIWCLFYEGH